MYKHHQDSINNFIEMKKKDPDILSIILGGSVARGEERENSDIDVMIIVNEKKYTDMLKANEISKCTGDGITYKEGYFDIKYFTKKYLKTAAEKGSEPTRNSFTGAKEIFSNDKSISEILHRIPQYPLHEKQERIKAFYSAYFLNKGYFWNQSQYDNIYLKLTSASDIVLFGVRIILAVNEILFSSNKRFLQTVASVPKKPERITALAEKFLHSINDKNKEIFCDAIDAFADEHINISSINELHNFVIDNEQWWYYNRPVIREW